MIDRVLDNFAILQDFFLKCKFDTATKENARIKHICSHMKANEVTLAHLHIVRVCIDFERFLELFQESSPLIHMLHDELTEVLRKLMLHFVKEDLVKGKPACTLAELTLGPENCIAADKFDVGSHAKTILRQLKADQERYGAYKTLCLDIKNFYHLCSLVNTALHLFN